MKKYGIKTTSYIEEEALKFHQDRYGTHKFVIKDLEEWKRLEKIIEFVKKLNYKVKVEIVQPEEVSRKVKSIKNKRKYNKKYNKKYWQLNKQVIKEKRIINSKLSNYGTRRIESNQSKN